MAGINKAILVGNVGRDPEIRALQSGSQVANFSLATSETWRDKNSGERKEKTEWHKISVFNEGLVKVVNDYVRKGSKLYIEGKIETRKWTDKDGQDRYSTEIVLSGFDGKIQMLDGRRDGDQGGDRGGYPDARSTSRPLNGASGYGEGDAYDAATPASRTGNGLYQGPSTTSTRHRRDDLDDEIPF